MLCGATNVSKPMECADRGACCLPVAALDRCCQQSPPSLCNQVDRKEFCNDLCDCEWQNPSGPCRRAATSRVDPGAPNDVLTCCNGSNGLTFAPTPAPTMPPTPPATPQQNCEQMTMVPFMCAGRSSSETMCTSGTGHCCDWFNGKCCQSGNVALCESFLVGKRSDLCNTFCQCQWNANRGSCEVNPAWTKTDTRPCCSTGRIVTPQPTPARKCPQLGINMQCPSRAPASCNDSTLCCFSSAGRCCQLTPSGHCSAMSVSQCADLCACEIRGNACQAASAPSYDTTDRFRVDCCGGIAMANTTAASMSMSMATVSFSGVSISPPLIDPSEIWVPIVATLGGLVLLAIVIGLVVCFVARTRANAKVKSARLASVDGHSSALTQRPSVGSIGTNETMSSGVAGYDKIPASNTGSPEFDSARVDNDDVGYDLVPADRRGSAAYSAPPLTLSQLAMEREMSGSDGALEHELEVRFSDLRLGKQLGEGAFAKVYRGDLRGREVAVKVLVGNKDESAVAQFRKEISLMRDLPPHPHVVALVGYCERPHLCICVEFCSGGSLDVYLRAHRTPLKHLLKWAADAANGVEHLHQHNVVHRDLAVRNLLLTFDNDIKVADFGLSRHTEKDAGHTKSDVGPLRWLAYESLVRKEYSPMSDAWMFGITLWEMLSGAQLPYADLTPAQVAIQVVTADLRPQQPDGCPDDVYALMQRCWQQDVTDRPTFVEIGKELRALAANLKKTKKKQQSPSSSSNSNEK
jgi:hypothetical protein